MRSAYLIALAGVPALVMGQGGFVTKSTTPTLTASASKYPEATVGSTIVAAGTSNYTTVVPGASAGSFVNFDAGTYNFPAGGITLNNPVNIRCPTGVCYFNCATVCFTLNGTNWNAISQTTIDQTNVGSIIFKDNATGAECFQKTPYALNVSNQFTVNQPRVRGGFLEIPIIFSDWYNSRRLYELSYGSCAHSSSSASTLSPLQFSFNSDCGASAVIKVAFDNLASCTGTYGIIESFPNIIYTSRVSIQLLENLRNIDPEHALRSPANRRTTSYKTVAVSIDSVQNITGVISANSPVANIEAKVVLVDIGSVNGVNQSRIVLELDTPQPFTLTGGDLLGPVLYSENLDSELATSEYNISATCTGTAVAPTLLCKQTLVFIATGCDLTASYAVEQLSLVCAPGSEVTCPLIEGYVSPVDINFYIATDNFCNVVQYSIDDLFNASIGLYTDNTYATALTYNMAGKTLGDPMHQKIVFDTKTSDVHLDDAVIIDLIRTSNGPCDATATYTNFGKNYNDGNGPTDLNQTTGTDYINYDSHIVMKLGGDAATSPWQPTQERLIMSGSLEFSRNSMASLYKAYALTKGLADPQYDVANIANALKQCRDNATYTDPFTIDLQLGPNSSFVTYPIACDRSSIPSTLYCFLPQGNVRRQQASIDYSSLGAQVCNSTMADLGHTLWMLDFILSPLNEKFYWSDGEATAKANVEACFDYLNTCGSAACTIPTWCGAAESIFKKDGSDYCFLTTGLVRSSSPAIDYSAVQTDPLCFANTDNMAHFLWSFDIMGSAMHDKFYWAATLDDCKLNVNGCYDTASAPSWCNNSFVTKSANNMLASGIVSSGKVSVKLAQTISAKMACATANQSANTFTQSYTIRVSYSDGRNSTATKNGGGTRKRRALLTRGGGDLSVASTMGITYDQEKLLSDTSYAENAKALPPQVNDAKTSSSNVTLIVCVVIAVLLICCCCITCIVGSAVYMKRSKNKKEKEAAMQETISADRNSMFVGNSMYIPSATYMQRNQV